MGNRGFGWMVAITLPFGAGAQTISTIRILLLFDILSSKASRADKIHHTETPAVSIARAPVGRGMKDAGGVQIHERQECLRNQTSTHRP